MARSEQRTVRVDDQVRIVAEAFGAPDDPALLLIGGATWSMDWWDDELCDRLAARGRLVLRYDQRDTGGSTSCPPGAPAYSSADLVTDALAVLDGFDVAQAHVVGLSMGGGLSQRLALEHRNRVATLTLISTTPIDPVENLPAPAPEIQALFAGETPEPAWDDREAVIDHIVEGERPFAGPGSFDEERVRSIAARVVDRTADIAASLTNHFLLESGTTHEGRLSELDGIPTLVIHGTADPLFPYAHGEALADAVPGATILALEAVGHQLPPPRTWDAVVAALIEHTA